MGCAASHSVIDGQATSNDEVEEPQVVPYRQVIVIDDKPSEEEIIAEVTEDSAEQTMIAGLQALNELTAEHFERLKNQDTPTDVSKEVFEYLQFMMKDEDEDDEEEAHPVTLKDLDCENAVEVLHDFDPEESDERVVALAEVVRQRHEDDESLSAFLKEANTEAEAKDLKIDNMMKWIMALLTGISRVDKFAELTFKYKQRRMYTLAIKSSQKINFSALKEESNNDDSSEATKLILQYATMLLLNQDSVKDDEVKYVI